MTVPTRRSRRAAVVAAVAAAVATALAPLTTAGPAAAQTGAAPAPAATIYERALVLHSGQALDILHASSADWQSAVQYPFHGGNSQQWERILSTTIKAPNGATSYQLRNRHTGKCLTATSQFESTPVAQLGCGSQNLFQHWYHNVVPEKTVNNLAYRFRFNVGSAVWGSQPLVLDVGNASLQADAPLVLFRPKALAFADNQLWNFQNFAIG